MMNDLETWSSNKPTNRLPGEFGLLPGDREVVLLYRETPGNNERVGRSALELGHCPCPNNKIFVQKSIQNIFLENKCKISEKQLELLANIYAYNLKKSQSLT